VADDAAFAGKVSGDATDAHGLDALDIGHDGGRVFGGVAGQGGGREGRSIDQRVVEDGGAGMVVDALNVVGGTQSEALVGLGHKVADIDAHAGRVFESGGNSLHEEVSDEGGVERAGAHGNEVSPAEGIESFRQSAGFRGIEHQFCDAELAGSDVGFAAHEGAIIHAGHEGGVGSGYGIDLAAGGQDLRGQLNGEAEVAGDLGEGGYEEIAEIVSLEAFAGTEAMSEEAGEQVAFLRQGHHAVAQVARGQHIEVLAQAAGGSAVIGDGDHGGEVADGFRFTGLAGCDDMAAQSAQQG
jgi:hypothetical protein